MDQQWLARNVNDQVVNHSATNGHESHKKLIQQTTNRLDFSHRLKHGARKECGRLFDHTLKCVNQRCELERRVSVDLNLNINQLSTGELRRIDDPPLITRLLASRW
jgi:hypothetical protein